MCIRVSVKKRSPDHIMYRRFSNAFMVNTKNISEICEHPIEMIKAMRQMMKITASRIHTEYVTDLFKQLKNLNLGTNEVMNSTKKLFRSGGESAKVKVVRCIMNEKLMESHKELKSKKREEMRYWRTVKPMILRERICEEFEEEGKSERTRKRMSYKERRKSKVMWMKNKYRRQVKDIPECWNNIIVGDQELNDQFDR